MKTIEALKRQIEVERLKLDRLISEKKLEASYQQSLLLDSLVEEYISITHK